MEPIQFLPGCTEGEEAVVLKLIISGGQTGADMAGLYAARELGYDTGGTAAPNFSTSKGLREQLLKSFGLSALPLESSWASSYTKRSMLNVDNATATVAFRVKSGSPGTEKTIGYCMTKKWKMPDPLLGVSSSRGYCELKGYKPVLVIAKFTSVSAAALRRFLGYHRVSILNVAGHRASREDPGWEDRVKAFLLKAIPRKG